MFVLRLLSLVFGAFVAAGACAQSRPVAFPGAEGFGRYASGGRGGRVYHVTTLEDGMRPGTFRHAVMQPGPRTVVFDVAGTIFLDSVVRILEGDLTIAGQTAPGDGICIAGYPVVIKSDNTIIRYMRFRVGNRHEGDFDGLGGTECRNVIIDHCTVSWSVDECCSIYGGENLTVQWCLVSESLRRGGHTKGSHGYGAIVGGARSSFHHNLLAHHDSRTPRLGPHVTTQEREHVDMRNNVIYNWAGNGCYGGEGMYVNIVNNYYKPGPATPRGSKVACRILSPGIRTSAYCTGRDGRPNRWKPMEHVWGRYYIDGNVVEGNSAVTRDNWSGGVYAQIKRDACDGTYTRRIRREMRLREPIATDTVTTHSAAEAYRLVLRYAGCSLRRDAIDRRIVEETASGTAACIGSVSPDAAGKPGLIDSPEDVVSEGSACPWPELKAGGVTADDLRDTDGDGIPDAWELAHGSDPGDASDGSSAGGDGYTLLEQYLNSIVAHIAERQNMPVAD